MTSLATLDPIKFAVATAIAKVCSAVVASPQDISALIFTLLEQPPEPQLGDYALPCFRIAKLANQNPQQFTMNLAREISGLDLIVSAEAAGAFLNMRIDKTALAENLLKSIQDGSYFTRLKSGRGLSRKVMIEHSQPNTHKDFHVGHVRNVALGDALVRLFRYQGDHVVAANYPGDEGTHIAKCLWYIRKEKLNPPASNQGEWLGEMYAAAVRELAAADAEAKLQNDSEVSAVLRAIESKKGDIFELWQQTREWSLALFREIYSYLNVDFDIYFFESELSEASQEIVDEFQTKGIFTQSEGAIGCDLTAEKLGFMLVRKRDGNTLYATKDLVLARRKFAEYAIEQSIYVVAAEQNLHFKQVFASLAKMGFAQAKECFHLSYGHVRLPEGKMSSRDGTAVTFASMRSAIETELSKVMADNEQNIPATQLLEIRQKLCIGAIKYGMLSTDPVKDVVYRAEDWVAFEGDTGPYLMYTYARAQSILRKAKDSNLYTANIAVDLNLLSHETEHELIRRSHELNTVVLKCCLQYKPSLLAHYLFDLCKSFNRMYNQVAILKSGSPALIDSRLYLVETFAILLKTGLQLIGIATVEKM